MKTFAVMYNSYEAGANPKLEFVQANSFALAEKGCLELYDEGGTPCAAFHEWLWVKQTAPSSKIGEGGATL